MGFGSFAMVHVNILNIFICNFENPKTSVIQHLVLYTKDNRFWPSDDGERDR